MVKLYFRLNVDYTENAESNHTDTPLSVSPWIC